MTLILHKNTHYTIPCKKSRSSHPEVFLGKGVLKICSKFTGEHPYRSLITRKLLWNFIEIAFRHGCSPVNLLHVLRTPFPKNTSEGLLLEKLFFLSIHFSFSSTTSIFFFYFRGRRCLILLKGNHLANIGA